MTERNFRRGSGILGVLLLLAGFGHSTPPVDAAPRAGNERNEAPSVRVLDDFNRNGDWTPHPADGVALELLADHGKQGKALRMDFEFTGGGYAIARKEVDLDLPANYAFEFLLRGECARNTLEFKLVDETGENVFWFVRPSLEFPKDWEKIVTKKRNISFAWGPGAGKTLEHVSAVEIVVTASEGGSGSVWIDDLVLRELPPAVSPETPFLLNVSASSAGFHSKPNHAVDADFETAWRPRSDDPEPHFQIDLGEVREWGGLRLQWSSGGAPREYRVLISDDRRIWNEIRRVRDGNGGSDALFLPESDSRFIRLAFPRGTPTFGLQTCSVRPLAESKTKEAFFEAVARAAPRGMYPKGILGEPTGWTVVGVDRDSRETLFGETGAIELGPGESSVEPFLFVGGQLRTWADTKLQHSLEGGALPSPRVTWSVDGLTLQMKAFGSGRPESSCAVVRYTVSNLSDAARSGALVLAVRPFQVNPTSQWLNARGGTARVASLDCQGSEIRIQDERRALFSRAPSRSGAISYDGGDLVQDFLAHGIMPSSPTAEDPEFEACSGAFEFSFDLAPGESTGVDLAVLLHGALPSEITPFEAAAIDAAEKESRREWAEKLGPLSIELPGEAASWVQVLRAQLGYILVNRAGPAIQPGARSYARSWIRDGALTSSALLRVGLEDPVREFIDWYAPHQYENGKIPCVVDSRGADPVPEHDSSGEFIFLVAEYARYTNDRKRVEELLPRVDQAATYLDTLRRERLGPEYATAETIHFRGLLPPSISHEGYSAKPMHSYWDDFFAVRGFRDAASLFASFGDSSRASHWNGIAEEFERDLGASVVAAMRRHSIDYVPGCADLGDFDATSTTIAFSPTGASRVLPEAALRQTFKKYLAFARDRSAGEPWEAYTPYELRNVGAFLRLGWREEAHELLTFFGSHLQPAGWLQWPEVVRSDTTRAQFLGDLPHTWVGSDFVRSFLDCFAYSDDPGELVLGAGVRQDWLASGGFHIRGLQTPFGELAFSGQREGDRLLAEVGAGLTSATRIICRFPGVVPTSQVRVNRKRVSVAADGSFLVPQTPASIEIDR